MECYAESGVNLDVKGQILDIDRFTSHDGPGIRTTVFLRGCPLKCIWCHSPESQSIKPQLLYRSTKCKVCFQCVSACPNNAIKANLEEAKVCIDRSICKSCGTCGRACPSKAIRLCGFEATVGEVLSIVVRDKAYYRNSGGGVTLSGGELLMQPDFSLNFLKACRVKGIHTAVETSGFGAEEAVCSIASAADLIFYDIKTMDGDEHKTFTGVSNMLILRNLERLCKNASVREKIVIRIPCIPSLNDSEHQIMKTAIYAAGLGIERIELLMYNEAAGAKYQWIGAECKLEGIKRQSHEYFEKLQSICTKEGLNIISYK